MSEKPVIFISHSSQDSELARLIKQQIELCFDNNVEAFAADINPGEDWFIKVMGKLNVADAIVVLITHYSVDSSHWVWFELGYFWARHDEALKNSDAKRKIYYPIYMKNVEWPNPVKDLQIQAALLSDKYSVLSFFEQLCLQFENGKIEHVQVDEIVEAVNAYPTRFLPPSDPNLLNAIRESQSDKHFQAILDDFLHSQYLQFKEYETNKAARWLGLNQNRDNIFRQKLITYSELDNDLKLPLGTSKRLLKDVAHSYRLSPKIETESGIRFEHNSEQ